MRIVVLGAGESGAGAAVLAKVKGFDTFVSDMSAIKDKYKELLDKYGIAWEEGHHTEELILHADEVVKSPGIPNDAPLIMKLKEKGTPIISEIEFAGRYTDAKMVCITGSNGKTTTTSLIYHIFKSAGLNVGLAGNIGNSLALQVATEQHDYYVIELSSFQLDNMYNFRANIAVLMNITPGRPLYAEICGRQIPHHPKPDTGRRFYLLERRPHHQARIRQAWPARPSLPVRCREGRRGHRIR